MPGIEDSAEIGRAERHTARDAGEVDRLVCYIDRIEESLTKGSIANRITALAIARMAGIGHRLM